jgi:hypothetical protein
MMFHIPWLIIPVIIYNAIAFFVGTSPEVITSTSGMEKHLTVFDVEIFSVTMLSGSKWAFSLGDSIMVITLATLFAEIMKATRTNALAIVDHGLSMVLFIICLVEFIMVPQASTSLFFIITVIALIDVVAGFSVGMRAARRDLSLGGGHLP